MHIRSLVAVSIYLVAGAALAQSDGSGSDSGDKQSLRMLAPAWIGAAPAYVADRLDYFEDEGIDVEFVQSDSRGGVGQMTPEDIDVDIRALGSHIGVPDTVTVDGIVLGPLAISTGADAVVVDGVVENTEDLVGRTVAIESNTPAHLLLQMALDRAGIAMDDVIIEDANAADAAITFADSAVDGVGTYAPYIRGAIETMANREARVLTDSDDVPGLIIDVIVARADDVESRRDVYQGFLRAIYRAVDYYTAEPESFAELASPFYGIRAEPLGELFAESLVFVDHAQAARITGTSESPGSLHRVFDRLTRLHQRFGNVDAAQDASQSIDGALLDGLFDKRSSDAADTTNEADAG